MTKDGLTEKARRHMIWGEGEEREGGGDLGYDDEEEDEERQEAVESTQPAKKHKERGHTCT